jgi:predicted GNAT family acetyltransferase
MTMEVELTIHNNAREFLDAVGKPLYASESVNNLILGVSTRLEKYPGSCKNPFFASVINQSGLLILAAVMTPPHNMILAGEDNFQKGFTILFSYLEENNIDIPGLIGPKQIIDRVLKDWLPNSKFGWKVAMRQRVDALKDVTLPKTPPGSFQKARTEHIPLIASWLQKFEAESLAEDNPINPERAGRLVNGGFLFVWEKDGEIVSMAMKTRPIKHSISIGCVYTPKAHRRKGYATALVAYLSQHLLDQGYHFVTLFTDLDNPTSNSIYMKIGYHPVCDFEQVNFR